MKVKEISKSKDEIVLEAQASSEEVNKALDAALFAFAQSSSLKPEGAKSISELAKEQLGIADPDSFVSEQALEFLVPYALDVYDLSPMDKPRADSESACRRNEAFTFTLYLTPKPLVKLESYDAPSLTVAPLKHDESIVEEHISHITQRYVDFEPDQARPIEDNDDVYIALEAVVDGNKFDPLCTQGRVYSLGRGFMPRAFDEALIGLNPGDSKTIEFDAPFTGSDGASREVKYICKVSIIEMRRRVVPELADEWVAKHVSGYDSVAALREGIDEAVRKSEQRGYEREIRNAVVAKFAEQFSAKLPQSILDNTLDSLRSDMQARLMRQGRDIEEYAREQGGMDVLKSALVLRAKQLIAQDYSLDALYAHKKLQYTDEDILSAAAEINPDDPLGLRQAMEASGRGFALREVAARHRAARWLVEHAQITVSDEKTS